MDAPMVDYGREPDHREHSSHRPRHRDETRGYSRSRSPSIPRDRYRSSRRRSRSRSQDRERDVPSRRRDFGRPREHRPVRDNPIPSEVLGVFGLSSYTREGDLEKLFGEYGRIEQVRIIYDRRTDVSRGFGFINFANVQDATIAKQKLDGLVIKFFFVSNI
ncbi:transformer 2 beta [Entomophthora muscae]|uniref:Transformer 2 beta n=1 Tax=Entomophthora muscae TaxID=34485 RepID=A0ACC2UFY1_9FUNG|nr:transformer 2 beta [Entomophthora muscae]